MKYSKWYKWEFQKLTKDGVSCISTLLAQNSRNTLFKLFLVCQIEDEPEHMMAASTIIKVYPYVEGISRVHFMFSLQELENPEEKNEKTLSFWFTGGRLSRSLRGQIQLKYPTKEEIKIWNHDKEFRDQFLQKFDNFERKALSWKLEFTRYIEDALRTTEINLIFLADKENKIYYINYHKTQERMLYRGNKHGTLGGHRGLYFKLKRDENGEFYYEQMEMDIPGMMALDEKIR